MDEILQRDDVKTLISEIKNNEKYFNKISTDSDMYYAKDISLYVFYEALLKYDIIFDNVTYLGEYIYDIDLLYRKIETIEDIKFGISKLITKFTIKYLNLEDVDNRSEVLGYIYSKYITNGYLIHGLSSVYFDNIKDDGFKPSQYFNYYDDFIILNELFKKYNKDNFIDKDFLDKKVYFTDDFVKSCIYSINSPMYFCNLLTDNLVIKNKKEDYYKDDYDKCIKHFNKIVDDLGFNTEDKKFAIDLVNKEWNLLHRNDKRIFLLLVRRDLFQLEDINLDDIIKGELDLNESVDKILTDRYKDISFDKDVDINDIKLVSFDIVDKKEKEEIIKEQVEKIIEKEKHEEEEKRKKVEFNDTYGMISPLLLLGSLCISLGVLISIIHLLGA